MFDMGSMFAPVGSVLTGDTQPQANESVTNLSAHVDGGPASTNNTNAANTDDEHRTLWLSTAIVLFAIAILWIMGSIVFKKVNL